MWLGVQAMAVANEVLEAQRSILRELSCDVFPRFQAHAMYEALCEEIGPDWRYHQHQRQQHRPLTYPCKAGRQGLACT